MLDSEFDLIHACFRKKARIFSAMTEVPNGDDASVHALPMGKSLVTSADMAVAGVHWPHDFPLRQAADRAVCAALSDLAAMGAEACWAWVSVMADCREALEDMGKGIADALNRYAVELSGGDTVHAPLRAINVTVAGLVNQGSSMQRDQAQVGDDVWLLGELGFSSLGLKQWMSGEVDGCFVPAFQQVKPKLSQGLALHALGVRCCMDVSDGLYQDAGHICRASSMGMMLDLATFPQWQTMVHAVGEEQAMQAMLSGGEDYALLFTAPKDLPGLSELATHIGVCCEGSEVEVHLAGQRKSILKAGYDHFA